MHARAIAILSLAVLVQCRLVGDCGTDRQTDGHTTTAYAALAQRRAVKTVKITLF